MKINKWIKSSKRVITPGGDPLWECGNCGCGEHVYGIENVNESKRYCPDCGSYNLYPWEEKTTRDEILKLLDKVKASSSDNIEFIVYGTEEIINQVKDYLPPNTSVKIIPDAYLPEQKDNLVYIIPIEEIKQPIKFIFEES